MEIIMLGELNSVSYENSCRYLGTNYIEVHVLQNHEVDLKMGAFWDIVLCSLGVDRRFRGVYCCCHKGVDGGSAYL
jgi:hypothetical protein